MQNDKWKERSSGGFRFHGELVYLEPFTLPIRMRISFRVIWLYVKWKFRFRKTKKYSFFICFRLSHLILNTQITYFALLFSFHVFHIFGYLLSSKWAVIIHWMLLFPFSSVNIDLEVKGPKSEGMTKLGSFE